MNDAYITGTGSYLPGDPVDNAELRARAGALSPPEARLRDRALAANGIRTRHYALDAKGQTLMLNEELAVHAISRALDDRGLRPEAVRMLATGTTQGDCLVPGFSSMVHGRLGGGPMELLSASGVCASGMAAMRAAVSAVRLGEHPVAVAAGSELVSRSLLTRPADTPDTGFLRWTLSDGAGAVVVEPSPRPDGLSLRVDWMHLVSHAHEHPVCMSAGLGDGRAVQAGSTWLDNGSAAPFGVPVLRQDMAVLPALLELGVAEFDALAAALGELAQVWAEFQRALSRVPVIRRIEDGTATLGDYRQLLLNLRQQVVDGGRWISLAAAHFSADWFWLRSAAIRHAADEHRDYQLLERDYAAVGGDPEMIASAPANVGSCALSAFVFHQAGQPDPVDLLGAMFVIEGLGVGKAGLWADRLQAHLGLTESSVSFLRYHAIGDDEHFEMLRGALRSGAFDDAAMARSVKTARVTARHAVLCEYAHARLRQLYVLCQGASAGAGCS